MYENISLIWETSHKYKISFDNYNVLTTITSSKQNYNIMLPHTINIIYNDYINDDITSIL